MKSIRTRAVAAAAAGVLAAGTLTAVALAAPADAASTATIHPYIGQHHHIRMARELRPGVHRIVVTSARQASFQIVRTRRGYTDRELVADVNASLNSQSPNLRALKRFERNVTLLGGVSSAPRHPGTMYVDLARGGRYLAVDTDTHVNRVSTLHHFRVTGSPVAGTMPAGPRIRAVKEATFAGRPKAIPGRGTLTFANRSTDNHFISMMKLLPGKSVKDFAAWVKSGGQTAPPVDMNGPELDTGVVSGGHAFAFHYRLPRGHYIVTCWWPDAEMGGMPHAFMGMFRELAVR
jgi:hypothetical protein